MPREPKPKPIEVGQIWKRADSEREIEIIGATNTALDHETPFLDITWKGHNFTGRGQTFEDSFRRRHTYVGKAKKK